MKFQTPNKTLKIMVLILMTAFFLCGCKTHTTEIPQIETLRTEELPIAVTSAATEAILETAAPTTEYADIKTEPAKSETAAVTEAATVFMECELDRMMGKLGFDTRNLNYEVHLADLYGEMFSYSVYFENEITPGDYENINQAIEEYFEPYYKKNIYLGDIFALSYEDFIEINLDLGNADPKYEKTALNGILKALNNVNGVKAVVINQEWEY